MPRPRPGSDAEPVHLLVDSTGLKLCEPGEWPPILVDRPPEPVLRSPDHQAHFVQVPYVDGPLLAR